MVLALTCVCVPSCRMADTDTKIVVVWVSVRLLRARARRYDAQTDELLQQCSKGHDEEGQLEILILETMLHGTLAHAAGPQ